MGKIKHYDVKIEVLGPLFIGSGQELKRSEFIHNRKNNRIYVMDVFKLFNGLTKLGLLKKYENYVYNNGIKSNLYNFFKENNISDKEYTRWSSYSYEVDAGVNYNKNILACIKDSYNMPYLPGSSLKGAIRTALLNAILLKSDKIDNFADSVETAKFIKRDKYLKKEVNQIEIGAFHKKREEDTETKKSDAVNSIFKGFRVCDSKPIATENIILCEKVDVFGNGEKNNLKNIIRECIKPGTIIETSIEIDTEIFKYSQNSIENAIKIMYNNTNKRYLSKFPNIHNEKGNLLYIGGGAGFVSKTAVYALFHEPKRALKNAGGILDKVSSNNKMGNHKVDIIKYGVSPRVRKCTYYKKKLYDFGLCRIEFQPIG